LELPSALNHLQPVNIPPERGKVGDLIDIILDDCYGLEQLQKKTSNPNLKILDVGANVGLFSLAARLNFPQAVIHAYEPNPNLDQYLKTDAETANFQYYLEALGAEDGRVKLNFKDVSFKTRSKVDPTGDVPMVSLSRAIERLGGRVDLAKLDCEGRETMISCQHSVKNPKAGNHRVRESNGGCIALKAVYW